MLQDQTAFSAISKLSAPSTCSYRGPLSVGSCRGYMKVRKFWHSQIYCSHFQLSLEFLAMGKDHSCAESQV